MPIRLTAPEVAFRRLRGTLERLARVPGRTAVIAAPKLTELLQEQFLAGHDPYGRAWAPLRASTIAKGRRPPPLTDTGTGADGTAAKPRSGHAGIRLRVGASYLVFAQVGFRVGRTRVKPRKIFPEFGLPRSWSLALRSAARQAGQEAIRA